MRNHTNFVVLEGNSVRDSEKITAQTGTPILKFTLACNKMYKDTKSVGFYDIVAFGKIADMVRQIHKGENVTILGELKQDTWEKDGKKNSRIEIVAHSVLFKDFPEKADGKQEAFQDDIPSRFKTSIDTDIPFG